MGAPRKHNARRAPGGVGKAKTTTPKNPGRVAFGQRNWTTSEKDIYALAEEVHLRLHAQGTPVATVVAGDFPGVAQDVEWLRKNPHRNFRLRWSIPGEWVPPYRPADHAIVRRLGEHLFEKHAIAGLGAGGRPWADLVDNDVELAKVWARGVVRSLKEAFQPMDAPLVLAGWWLL